MLRGLAPEKFTF